MIHSTGKCQELKFDPVQVPAYIALKENVTDAVDLMSSAAPKDLGCISLVICWSINDHTIIYCRKDDDGNAKPAKKRAKVQQEAKESLPSKRRKGAQTAVKGTHLPSIYLVTIVRSSKTDKRQLKFSTLAV